MRTATSSPWTAEDRALMMAWSLYKGSLCPGCKHPTETAWSPDSDGWFETLEPIQCHACTALQKPDENGLREPVTYPVVVDTRDEPDPLRDA